MRKIPKTIPKTNRSVSRVMFLIAFSTLIVWLGTPAPVIGIGIGDAMTAEEVVRRHIESIGIPKGNSLGGSRIIAGDCSFHFRGRGIGSLEGKAIMASESDKALIGMTFPSPEYPNENLGFDGRTLNVGFIRPGVRTVLGDFLLAHDVVFREGLIGGTLSTTWPLLDISARSARLRYDGKRKISGREVYVLDYLPRKGSELHIVLYFDSLTFQHIRTEYSQMISSQLGKTDKDSAGQRSTNYELVEEFADFFKEAELSLPHTYNLHLSIENQTDNIRFDWSLRFQQFAFNRPLPAGWFKAEESDSH